MKKTLCLLATAATLTMPQALAVTQKLKIDLNAQHSKGDQTFHLKRMLNGKFGKGIIKGHKLQKVVLQAKSKKGNADANLAIGYSETAPEVIPGTVEQFDSDFSGFHAITLSAPLRAQQEVAPWKVHLKGNIKIDSIKAVTKLEPSYPYSKVGALSFKMVNSFKVDKIIGDTKKINVGKDFKAVQLTAKGSVSITSVKVKFADGQVVFLDELEGKVKGPTSFKFNKELAKEVKFLEISAVSTNLFGSRGELQVSIAKKKGAQTQPTRPTRPTRPSRPARVR